MTDEEILVVLKLDLQVSSVKLDTFLLELIQAAKEYIGKEGIQLNSSHEDGMLVETYAAFLYRKRREADVKFPKNLRWNLNNRLFSQKAGG